jgi:hypothetical protein
MEAADLLEVRNGPIDPGQTSGLGPGGSGGPVVFIQPCSKCPYTRFDRIHKRPSTEFMLAKVVDRNLNYQIVQFISSALHGAHS